MFRGVAEMPSGEKVEVKVKRLEMSQKYCEHDFHGWNKEFMLTIPDKEVIGIIEISKEAEEIVGNSVFSLKLNAGGKKIFIKEVKAEAMEKGVESPCFSFLARNWRTEKSKENIDYIELLSQTW